MTIKELKKVTKCRIFVERDDDGVMTRKEYMGATRDYQIRNIEIIHMEFAGWVLCVELEDE